MEELSMFLAIVFEIICIIAAVTFFAWMIIDYILTSLRNGESKEQKHYKRLRRTLQKSIQKIGSKDTIQNLRIALFHVDGLEELSKKLIERKEFERKNFNLELELHKKDMQIARLEYELKKSKSKKGAKARNENSDNGNA